MSLGLEDLGQLYHQPIKDAATGAIVLVTVRSIKDPKSIDTTHVRWLCAKKAQRRFSSTDGGMLEGSFGAQWTILNAVHVRR